MGIGHCGNFTKIAAHPWKMAQSSINFEQ